MEPQRPGAPDNLHAPADGERDFGAHGRFDDRARSRSTQQWAARCLDEPAGRLSGAVRTPGTRR
ncbi:hypothetical protein ACFV2Q_18995 [Streptomyces sp. NPDC059650]|uniref:hypothetical protein n=1 Tax=Streptomyces sp. NPDC059650 TaxID=3346896 RepID=UPI003680D114